MEKVTDVFEETQAESRQDASDGLDKRQHGKRQRHSSKHQAAQGKKEGEEVDEDVMDWLEVKKRVRRGKVDNEDCRMVQIFVKMDGVQDNHDGGCAE